MTDDYHTWARYAALAERNGNFKQASEHWAKAAMLARCTENKFWAEARQDYCELVIQDEFA